MLLPAILADRRSEKIPQRCEPLTSTVYFVVTTLNSWNLMKSTVVLLLLHIVGLGLVPLHFSRLDFFHHETVSWNDLGLLDRVCVYIHTSHPISAVAVCNRVRCAALIARDVVPKHVNC